MKLIRYFHTLRHLRVVQITGRLWHRLNPAKPDLRTAPSISPAEGHWEKSVERQPSMLSGDTFRFLNTVGQVRNCASWNDPVHEKLWLYNLHYFDDLNAESAAARAPWHRGLVARWVAENPPAFGNGWEPYPTSLRIVNWVKWALAGNELEPAWLQSLAVQSRWLHRHIEWHLLGNHLFVNAKALVFAGLFFAGDEADAWLAKGLIILSRELPEQVLADGAHFELSPMYHAIILEDLLDLVNAAGVWPGRVSDAAVAKWREVAGRMLPWLAGMIHPDGEIAFFNDAALGIAPNFLQLSAYAGRLQVDAAAIMPGKGCTHFADSGYVRLENGDAVALLDVARIGPDYLPGHAHADTLSFELSLFKQRVIVNCGTSEYGTGINRLKERGTAAHSTVEIDGEDSSEVWSGFRVARRANPLSLRIQEYGDDIVIGCAHDGYIRLPGRTTHQRVWKFSPNSVVVEDRLTGRFKKAVARFHFHPLMKIVDEGSGRFSLDLTSGTATINVLCGGAQLEPSSYSPEFGKMIKTSCLAVYFRKENVTVVEIKWRSYH